MQSRVFFLIVFVYHRVLASKINRLGAKLANRIVNWLFADLAIFPYPLL